MTNPIKKNAEIFASFAVDDAKKAKAFYSDTLGLRVEEYDDMEGMFEIQGGGASVFVYEKGAEHKAANFTVLNIPVNDIEKTMADLKARGVTFEVYDGGKASGGMKTDQNGLARMDEHGMSMAWFKDPAGNVVSLIEE